MLRLFTLSLLCFLAPILVFDIPSNADALIFYFKNSAIILLIFIILQFLLKRLQQGLNTKSKTDTKLNNIRYAATTIVLVIAASILFQLMRLNFNAAEYKPALITLLSATAGFIMMHYAQSRKYALTFQWLPLYLYFFSLVMLSQLIFHNDIYILPAALLALSLGGLFCGYYFSGELKRINPALSHKLDQKLLGLTTSAGLSIFSLLPALRYLPAYYFVILALYYQAFKLVPRKNDDKFNLAAACKLQDRVFYYFIAIMASLRAALAYFIN